MRIMNRTLVLFLDFLEVAYTLAAVEFILMWLGLQVMPPNWQQPLLPFYALVSAAGAASVWAIFNWRKWGVYGLATVWLLTAWVYLVFTFPTWHLPVAGLVVVASFIALIRPVWKHLR